MKTFRMLCDGVEEWRGKAHDVEHAEDRCFFDESPGELNRYTLQRWKPHKKLPAGKWVTIYESESLAG